MMDEIVAAIRMIVRDFDGGNPSTETVTRVAEFYSDSKYTLSQIIAEPGTVYMLYCFAETVKGFEAGK